MVTMHGALQGFVKVAVQTGASLVPVRLPLPDIEVCCLEAQINVMLWLLHGR